MLQHLSLTDNPVCSHASAPVPNGLVLVAIGNSLRGDDGAAARLAAMFKKLPLSERVCCFDIGIYTGYLGKCLSGHKAAIILDATQNGTAAGTVSIMDLRKWLERKSLTGVSARSSHGLSFGDELRFAAKTDSLPETMIFFGIEAGGDCLSDKLSENLERKLPNVLSSLSGLAKSLLEENEADA